MSHLSAAYNRLNKQQAKLNRAKRGEVHPRLWIKEYVRVVGHGIANDVESWWVRGHATKRRSPEKIRQASAKEIEAVKLRGKCTLPSIVEKQF